MKITQNSIKRKNLNYFSSGSEGPKSYKSKKLTNFNYFVSGTDSPKDQKSKKLTTSNSFSSGTDSPNDYKSKGSTYFKPLFSKTKQQKSKCHKSSNTDHKSKKLTTFDSFSSGTDSPNDYESKGSTYSNPIFVKNKTIKSKYNRSSNFDQKSKKSTTFKSFSSGTDSPNDYKSKKSTYFKPLITKTKQKKPKCNISSNLDSSYNGNKAEQKLPKNKTKKSPENEKSVYEKEIFRANEKNSTDETILSLHEEGNKPLNTQRIHPLNTPRIHILSNQRTHTLSNQRNPLLSIQRNPPLSMTRTPPLSNQRTPHLSNQRTPPLSDQRTPQMIMSQKDRLTLIPFLSKTKR